MTGFLPLISLILFMKLPEASSKSTSMTTKARLSLMPESSAFKSSGEIKGNLSPDFCSLCKDQESWTAGIIAPLLSCWHRLYCIDWMRSPRTIVWWVICVWDLSIVWQCSIIKQEVLQQILTADTKRHISPFDLTKEKGALDWTHPQMTCFNCLCFCFSSYLSGSTNPGLVEFEVCKGAPHP